MEHAVDLGSRSGDEKPIIFDIVACDSTKQLLKPVLRDGIDYVAQWFPKLKNYTGHLDELLLLLDVVVEGFSIQKQHAGIAEAYYGIQRASTKGKLNTLQKLLSLLHITVLPYLLEKIPRKLKLLRDGGRMSGRQVTLCSLPLFLYHGGNFILNWLYIFSNLATTDVLMLLSRTKYCRRDAQGESDYPMLLNPLGGLMFVLRFIQWWRENSRDLYAKASETPPAPVKMLQGHDKSIVLTIKRGNCPICKQSLSQPTALVSGVVFCKACLYDHAAFTEEGRCPITSLPVGHVQPRQLFVQDS